METRKGLDGRTRPRLLVVEDNFPVAEGLRYLLEGLGCDVAGMADFGIVLTTQLLRFVRSGRHRVAL